ncbi:hypothetical protein [Phytohabitans houttuyneae]|uniref:Uncharacterized protein n=1 Tax=Phytohabitans houttuyneae TaxID=1076126 RepID=A0A6V8K293_9ACTN|nr:hypothetical protein [Phytohabitans houttuyneae]GFJ76481.1 hypothetical protein Phou_006610 [Phytohabitans houttuyneae]
MNGPGPGDHWLWFAAIALIAWLAAVAAIVLIVLLPAKWAITRAAQKDIPRIMGGIPNLLSKATRIADLATGGRGSARTGGGDGIVGDPGAQPDSGGRQP